MIKETLEASRSVRPRTILQVLGKLMEEVGELSVEVLIKDGFKRRLEGKDGIIGEAVDAATCCIDIIYMAYPNITEEEIMTVVRAKLDKWKAHKGR